MLKMTKAINLNGESKIGEATVVMLSASISSVSSTTINKIIVRQDLYQDNKDIIKADMDTFELEVMTLVDTFPVEEVAPIVPPAV